MNSKDLFNQTQELLNFMEEYPKVTQIPTDKLNEIYLKFVDVITDHNHLYYVKGEPIISDFQYDQLFDYLKRIEEAFPYLITGNSPTQQLVGQVAHNGEIKTHKVKLLSLENTYNEKDIRGRRDRIQKSVGEENVKFLIEPKFDGISVEIIYRNGVLTNGITRGDGEVGEDISENIKAIVNLPQKLKKSWSIAVRGEILMPKSVLQELNKQRLEQGENLFANTRNATAGSIKLLDFEEVKSRNLHVFVYQLLWFEGKIPEIEKLKFDSEVMKLLRNIGLPIFERSKTVDTIDKVVEICSEKTKKELEKYDFDFDGLVVKVDNLSLREKIGSTSHHPKRAIAYKFPAEQVVTKLKAVEFSVGRTGIITPVGILEPVKLSGATISRVTLHNFDFINSKDIHIGDKVWIQRSGEVIPYVISVVKDARDKDFDLDSTKIAPPKFCPSCGSEIVDRDGHYFCPNSHCPAQIKEKILYFVSKDAMNIKGIGASFVDILLEQKLVSDIADIYKIETFDVQVILRRIPGIGDKKIAEIVSELRKSKDNELWRFINGLGILGVGKKLSMDLEKNLAGFFVQKLGKLDFEDLKQRKKLVEMFILQMQDLEFLSGIYGVGEVTARNIKDFFASSPDLIWKFFNFGYKFKFLIQQTSAGIHFSVTGTFSVSREKIVEEMERNGYIFDSNITSSTKFLLVGQKPGSKLAKAEKKGIEIISGEDVFSRFPFLKNLKNNKKKIDKKPKMQSLF